MGFLPATYGADEVVFMPLRATIRDVYELEYDGWGLVAAVDDLKTENTIGRVETSLTDRGTGLSFQRSFTVLADSFAAEDLDEVMELRSALRRANGIALIFHPLNRK